MNKFKDKGLNTIYNECVRAFSDNESFLYWKGEQRRGSAGMMNNIY